MAPLAGLVTVTVAKAGAARSRKAGRYRRGERAGILIGGSEGCDADATGKGCLLFQGRIPVVDKQLVLKQMRARDSA